MNLSTSEIETALDTMRYEKHVVYQVSQAGSRVPKYKHNIEKIGTFSEADMAALCVLMLRGPQTVGEIKTHSGRLHAYAALSEVDQTLEELRTSAAGPFVVKLAREPGKREQRFVHLLGGDQPEAVGDVDTLEVDHPAVDAEMEASMQERMQTLGDEVASLREELAMLKADLGIQATPVSGEAEPASDQQDNAETGAS